MNTFNFAIILFSASFANAITFSCHYCDSINVKEGQDIKEGCDEGYNWSIDCEEGETKCGWLLEKRLVAEDINFNYTEYRWRRGCASFILQSEELKELEGLNMDNNKIGCQKSEAIKPEVWEELEYTMCLCEGDYCNYSKDISVSANLVPNMFGLTLVFIIMLI